MSTKAPTAAKKTTRKPSTRTGEALLAVEVGCTLPGAVRCEHKEPGYQQPATKKTDTHAETGVLEVGACVLLLADETDTDLGAKALLDDESKLLLSAWEVLLLAMALALALSVVALALKVLAVDDDGRSESLVQSFETVGGALTDVDGAAELDTPALVLGAGGWVVPGCVEAGELGVVL